MKPICVKGKRISKYLIQTEKVTYPMEDTKYLAMLPMYRECYLVIQKLSNNQYKLLKYLFVN